MEYYSAIRKNETMPFAATWMDLRIITLSKTKKKTCSIWYHLYVESKIWHNALIYKTETDSQTEKSAQDMRKFQQTRQSPWTSEWTCNPKGSYRLDYVSRKTTKKNKQTRQPQKLFPGSPSNSDLVLSGCCFVFLLSLPLGNKLKLCVYFYNTEKHREKASQKNDPVSRFRDLPTTHEKEK